MSTDLKEFFFLGDSNVPDSQMITSVLNLVGKSGNLDQFEREDYNIPLDKIRDVNHCYDGGSMILCAPYFQHFTVELPLTQHKLRLSHYCHISNPCTQIKIHNYPDGMYPLQINGYNVTTVKNETADLTKIKSKTVPVKVLVDQTQSERGGLNINQCDMLDVVIPKAIYANMSANGDFQKHHTVEYQCHNGTVFETVNANYDVQLPFNHQIISIMIDGLPNIRQKHIVKVLGNEVPFTLEPDGSGKLTWIIRTLAHPEIKSSTDVVNGNVLNFSRLERFNIIFDPAICSQHAPLKLTFRALTFNRIRVTKDFFAGYVYNC